MLRPLASIASFALTAVAAGAAQAQCQRCNLPTTHQVVVPGVTVTPPTITVGSPSLGCNTCGEGGGGGFGSINVTVNVEQNAQAAATTSASTSALSNAAAANLIIGGGGGGGWFDSGPSTSIGNLTVVTNDTPPPPPPATPRVCVARKAVFTQIAIQAVCLDDKGSPHPASQTNPDREVAPGFKGELYRCVAGSHMQYIIAEYAGGAASFDRGQTKVCSKGDALWVDAGGQVQCRPQTPARDCNERSLLRRYGPGIKVMKAAGAEVCSAWSTETVAAAAPVVAPAPPPMIGQSFAGDGGVGHGGW